MVKNKKKFIFWLWKVYTVLDRVDTFVDTRVDFIARELAHYRFDIAALSEMCFIDEGSVCKPAVGYNFLLEGHSAKQGQNTWKCFTISNTLLC